MYMKIRPNFRPQVSLDASEWYFLRGPLWNVISTKILFEIRIRKGGIGVYEGTEYDLNHKVG